MPPRLRHIGIARDTWSVRPYVQLLNTSAWLIYDCDVDPQLSTPEYLAYLLVHGDRMAMTGEVTAAALQNGAYWIERTDEECGSFAQGAQRSTRPDADGFRALAAALPWLRQLAHETLRPATLAGAYRTIPATGLSVRKDMESRPVELLKQWTEAARGAISRFRSRQTGARAADVARVCDRLASTSPYLLITGRRDRILWDPEVPGRTGALRNELKTATAAALNDVAADLDVIRARTVAFHEALRDAGALPAPQEMEHQGYTYLHAGRRLIAYNLHEPGLERLQSPAIPYARAMLGARTVHEWCHLAVEAGWVPLRLTTDAFERLIVAAAQQLAAVVDAAPAAVRDGNAADLRALISAEVETDGIVGLTRNLQPNAGAALIRIILRRWPDYGANVLAQRFLTTAERETYVRQNIRQLRNEYTPQRLWRMLARYLYEYQYLTFSEIADREEYFLRSTWFDADFVSTGILDRPTFRSLTESIAAICRAFAVDETKFNPVPPPEAKSTESPPPTWQ